MNRHHFLVLIFLILFPDPVLAKVSEWYKNTKIPAETRLLITKLENIDNQKNNKIIVAVELKINDGWKVYANDASGMGMPPSPDFKGTLNYLNHKILWPKAEEVAEKIGADVIKYSVYHQKTIIPIEVELSKIENNHLINLHLDYGICRDICIPASADFKINVEDFKDENSLKEINKFFPILQLQAGLKAKKNNVETKIVDNFINGEKSSSEGDKNNFSAVENQSNSLEKIEEKNIERLENKKGSNKLLFLMIFVAMFGGLILNVMPCVLPVLSLKIISLIKHGQSSKAEIRYNFFAITLGILTSFICFAIIAIIIKLSGNYLGWGLQFQNKYFLMFVITLLVLFIGSLLEWLIISFDNLSVNLLHQKINRQKNIFIANFLSGVLAVLLATPCSAPILGSALSFAITQNYFILAIITIAIGIGFAMPYLLIMLAPKLISFLPKPGAWMKQVKNMMISLLIIAIIWLAHILATSIGYLAVLAILFFNLILLLLIKNRDKISKILNFILINIVIIGLLSVVYFNNHGPSKIDKSNNGDIWQEFNEEDIEKHVMQGRVVLIDITADWCITCKINKMIILENKEIIKLINQKKIITMRGDITISNPKIMSFLTKHKRFAIPFNIVYGPNAKEGLILSEILNKDRLVELIIKADNQDSANLTQDNK